MSRHVVARWLSLLVFLLASCGGAPPPEATSVASPRGEVVLSVVGTSDLHGHLRALPILAGHVVNLRNVRDEDGGAVILLDGGDLFQGTLESNLNEGAPVIAAYAQIGYDALAIGNHEFDFGPVGPRTTPSGPDDDPRGALLARAAEAAAADVAMLSANLRQAAGGGPIDWPNVSPTHRFSRVGVEIGVIGLTTEDTLSTTIAANVADLAVEPLAAALERESSRMRAEGVEVVLLAAHAGGKCERFDAPHDLSSCDAEQEIFVLLEAVPEGTVDAVVAGHTHAGVAHIVRGVPVIQSWAYGRGFGRVDLRFDLEARRVVGVNVHPPREICAEGSHVDGSCRPAPYEGRPVEPDAAVAAIIAPALEAARELAETPLGVEASAPITRARSEESALGNLFTDLMLASRADADVAMTNGGGLRADLPAGLLTYGDLHLASPFDNRFARLTLSGAELAAVIADNLGRTGSFFSFAGIRAEARCVEGRLEVRLEREDGRAIEPDEALVLVTTDFLATGGDGALGEVAGRDDALQLEEEETVRDAMAAALRARSGRLDPLALHDPARPRIRAPGPRPVSCPMP